MGLLSQQYGKVIELTAGSCLTAPIICGSTCVQSAQILSTKVSVGSLNTSYDLYNNGTSYLNGAVTIDDTVTANNGSVNCRLSVSGATDFNGIAIGCTYSNTGNWHSQFDIYGGGHSVLRINPVSYTHLTLPTKRIV